MLRAGTLNRLVTIQRPGPGKDAAGQPVDAPEVVAAVWANVRYMSGSEAIRAGATTSKLQASIRIRRRTDITAGMRVLHEGRLFNITAVLPDADRVAMDLVCEVTE